MTFGAQTAEAALALTFQRTDVSCNGGSNGSLGVTVTGGSGQYSYAWAPSGGTEPVATGLSAGTYRVTVSDLVTAEVVESDPQPVFHPSTRLNIPFSQTNIACNGNDTGAVALFPTGGTPPYTYQWSPGGETGSSISGLSAGSYSVTVTDHNSCQETKTFTINQPEPLRAAVAVQTTVSCNGGSNGSAVASATGGTPGYYYDWSPSNQTTPTATGLAAGQYTVTVTDEYGCSDSASVVITQPSALSLTTVQTNVACNGGSTGALSANVSGGTGAYRYDWSTGASTPALSGLTAGVYDLTVTDDNSCQVLRSFTLTQPSPVQITVDALTNPTCHGSTNGGAAVSASGGAPGYAYAWAPSGHTAPTVAGLAAGTHTVTVTDANACRYTHQVDLTDPLQLEVATTATDVSCHGGQNGVASAVATGGTGSYAYAWSQGAGTAPNAAGLGAGEYTVTVSDDNACTASSSVIIAQPGPLEIAPSQTDVSCPGGADGTATAIVSGGTGSYAYDWSPTGGTAATASGLGAGAYTLTVTDDNACVRTHDYTLVEPAEAVITVDTITNATCNGGADGGAAVSVTGGTPGYTYAWSPSGGTDATLEDQAAGTYTVTVRDANACEYTRSLAIAEPEAIVVTLAASTPADCSDEPGGALTVAATGGSEGYVYDWSPGEPTGDGTESISDLPVGAYSVQVEDMNGCAGEGTFEVLAATDIAPVATASSATVAQDGSLGLMLRSTYAGCFDRVYRIVDEPENGTLAGTPPEVVYTPAPGYFGPDAFTFEVTAGDETSAPALVSITVTESPVIPENTVPTAHPLAVTTDVATPVTLTLSGSDLDGDQLTYAIQTEPRFGTLSGTPPLVTYTPAGAEAYEDEFTFVVDDGQAISAPATVSVIVEAPVEPGEDPVEPGKNPPAARKDDEGGCSAAGNGGFLAGLLLVGAFLGLRRREGSLSGTAR